MTPQRIQLRRSKGFRKPEGAIVVSRPSKWPQDSDIRLELAGWDLCCWCPVDRPCHADTLLAISNDLFPALGHVGWKS